MLCWQSYPGILIFVGRLKWATEVTLAGNGGIPKVFSYISGVSC